MAKNRGNGNKIKSVPGGTIKTEAVINQLTIGKHEDKISFTSLHLNADENEIITRIVQDESPIALVIDLPKPDKNFPPIEVRGQLKKYTINKTCDSPNIIGLQFSSGQVEQLTNYIRAEQEIKLKIVQLQGELFGEEDPQEVA